MANLPADRFVYTNGIRMHCLDWGGDKPPLVATQGTTLVGAIWTPTVEFLAPHFRVIAMDMRAHGDSDHPPHGYSWLNLGRDVAGFVEGLKLERKPLMLCHSRGGGCAMQSARFAAHLWAGAIFIEPSTPLGRRPGRPGEVRRESGETPADQALGRRAIFPDREAAFRQYQGKGMFRGWLDENLKLYLKHAMYDRVDGQVELKMPPDLEAKYYSAVFDDDHPEVPNDVEQYLEAASYIKCPTMLAYGERGQQVFADPPPGIKRFLEITHGETGQLPGGHFMMMTYPQAVAELVIAFARKHKIIDT